MLKEIESNKRNTGLEKKELASLVTLKATGWAPKVTIKDLVVVESNLEPTYFDNEDNDDSQEEISEGKSSHKPRKIKSGKAAKSSEISVKNPQHWPHYFVPGQRTCNGLAVFWPTMDLAEI